MNVHLIKSPFSYIVIDDFYTNEELSLVMQEVIDLEPHSLNPDATATAVTPNKEPLKSGKGLFLYEHFKNDPTASKLMPISRKIFSNELNNIFISFDASFAHIKRSTYDAVLLNFYRNKDKYLPHTDDFPITAITFLKVGEFEGGNFLFPEYNETVQFKHNRIVIFHGCIQHQAEEIRADDNSYRVSIAHFIGYK
jgi:hypothetical protein